MSDLLTGSLEDNVLTMLCYDETNAHAVALRVQPELFSTRAYQKIAREAVNYLEKFNKPPRTHLRDVLEGDLRRGEEGRFLLQVLEAMATLSSDLQADYVLGQLDRFISARQLSQSLEQAADLLHAGDLEGAQEAIHALPPANATSFQASSAWFHDDSWLSFLDEEAVDELSSGVDVLDERGVVPARGEMFLIIAATGRGKSWWLIQIGKHSTLLAHKKVLHISLENSLRITQQRYTQAFLGLTREETHSIRVPLFKRDSLGRFISLDFSQITPDSLKAPQRRQVAQALRPYQQRSSKLLLQWFPMGSLTVGQLSRFLDVLERQHKFRPDVVVLDYADKMQIDGRDPRVATGRLFTDLRGLAGRRDFALVTATQGNRYSADARLVTSTMVAEDWSKIGTADTVVTYSQTLDEKDIGLARLLVDKARNSRDKWTAMITQSYETGQFCLDSTFMSKLLEEEVRRYTGAEDEAAADSK